MSSGVVSCAPRSVSWRLQLLVTGLERAQDAGYAAVWPTSYDEKSLIFYRPMLESWAYGWTGNEHAGRLIRAVADLHDGNQK